MARTSKNVTSGIVVEGLQDMQRVLRRVESELGPELKKRLKASGERHVAPAARANAPRRSGALAGSIKVGVTQRGATIYSTSVYGGAQNFGGRVGRDRATVLKRADVSQYMTRAVENTRTPVADEVEGVLDWLARELS